MKLSYNLTIHFEKQDTIASITRTDFAPEEARATSPTGKRNSESSNMPKHQCNDQNGICYNPTEGRRQQESNPTPQRTQAPTNPDGPPQ
eukprot:scaffold94068_cov38-Cyclotella_meneghiniana.AAC.3